MIKWTTFTDMMNNIRLRSPDIYTPEMEVSDVFNISFSNDVFIYGVLLFKLLSKEKYLIKLTGRGDGYIRYRKFISRGGRAKLDKTIPPHYCDLIKACWCHSPDERLTFAEITEHLLKDDFCAIDEDVDLDDLHDYQKKNNE